MVLNGGMVTFCVVWTEPLTSLSPELLHLHSVTLLRGAYSPFCNLTLVWAAMGELQWPQHDCPKVGLFPCHGSLCKLPHSHETKSFVDYHCVHHDQNCLGVGHGGDNQQQYILIIVFYPTESGGLPPQTLRYGIAAPPIPSSSNNWPRGWICRVRSLQNWALMLNIWPPKSIKAVTSCPSIITGASLECPD